MEPSGRSQPFLGGGLLLGAGLLCGVAAFAQRSPSDGISADHVVPLNVVVMTSSGQFVTDLQEPNFKVFDNNSRQVIASFKSVFSEPRPYVLSQLTNVANVRGASLGTHGELFQYELTFEAPTPQKPNEYHAIEVRVDRPGLIVTTRNGYWARRSQIVSIKTGSRSGHSSIVGPSPAQRLPLNKWPTAKNLSINLEIEVGVSDLLTPALQAQSSAC
jgi:hypothetical protein